MVRTAPSSYARIAIPAFRSFGIEPIAFVDDDLDRQGKEFLGVSRRRTSTSKESADTTDPVVIIGVCEQVKVL